MNLHSHIRCVKTAVILSASYDAWRLFLFLPWMYNLYSLGGRSLGALALGTHLNEWMARLLAASSVHRGDWLQVLPIAALWSSSRRWGSQGGRRSEAWVLWQLVSWFIWCFVFHERLQRFSVHLLLFIMKIVHEVQETKKSAKKCKVLVCAQANNELFNVTESKVI